MSHHFGRSNWLHNRFVCACKELMQTCYRVRFYGDNGIAVVVIVVVVVVVDDDDEDDDDDDDDDDV